MITRFIILTLASLSLSSCFSFGLWGFTVERKDITTQPAYEPLTKKTLKTQRDYYVRNSYIQWDNENPIQSTVSSLELNEHQGSDALFYISKGTSFKLLKVEQVYSSEGRDSTLRYRGDYATLHFPLDIACGNGNFTERMVQQGATVLAFDYSSTMIQCATKRRASILSKGSFHVCDATDYHALKQLEQLKPFTKAVANMALMDISDIEPLFLAVYEMLQEGGCFVFAMHPPCFTFPNGDYFTSNIEKGIAIEGQPALQNYYHRSLSDLLNLAFKIGFVLDSLAEVPFKGDHTPIIMTARLVK